MINVNKTKTLGAILLVAGTCIGSGMIALPIVLARLGLIPSLLLMVFTWFVMYYTSLMNLELNLQAGRGLSLGLLGRMYSGQIASLIGTVCLKILSYSLLAVFINGGSSIVHEFFMNYMETDYSLHFIALILSIVSLFILSLPVQLIDYINRIMFVSLITVVIILVSGLILSIEWPNVPLVASSWSNLQNWITLIPIVFTSFGFQVIFHTMTEYCDKNKKLLKAAFFWGSLIPAIIYIFWTSSILSTVYVNDPMFYQEMIAGKVEVGELILVLSNISKWQSIQLLVWIVSLLAMATSIIGVGKGLQDTLDFMLSQYLRNRLLRQILSLLITIVPALLTVIFIPNAFIAALSFAGMILSVIAIMLPLYIFNRLKIKKLHYNELNKKWLILISAIFGLLVIVCEGAHLLSG